MNYYGRNRTIGVDPRQEGVPKMCCTSKMFAEPNIVRKNLSQAYEERETKANVEPYSTIWFPKSETTILTNSTNLSKNPGLQKSIAKHGYTPKPGAYLGNLKESRESAPPASNPGAKLASRLDERQAQKYAAISAASNGPKNMIPAINRNIDLSPANKAKLKHQVIYEYGANSGYSYPARRSKTRKNKRSNKRRQSRRTRGY